MKNHKDSIAVIGLGYIGLPTAAVLSSHGSQVIGVDVNEHAVSMINQGKIHIVEPGLEEAVANAVSKGLLRAQTDTPEANVYIVAVPTPFKDSHQPDLSYIESAADAISPRLKGGELVILESTSPPGATEHMANRLVKDRPDLSWGDKLTSSQKQIYVAHCPERVLPGYVMEEMITNDRIVGGLTPESAERAKSVYEIFCKGEVLTTDARTAEMAKLVENSYRDVNIAFANELSVISDQLGINVWELIRLANHHPRVNILQPGPGVGGHCIAVDPWFIVAAAPESARLIQTARETNDAKPQFVIDKIAKEIENGNKEISIFGLSFKKDIDDLRESPAVNIVEQLASQFTDVSINVVEPHVQVLPDQLSVFDNIKLVDTKEAIRQARVIVLLVDHTEFKDVPETLDKGQSYAIIDTRGYWLE